MLWKIHECKKPVDVIEANSEGQAICLGRKLLNIPSKIGVKKANGNDSDGSDDPFDWAPFLTTIPDEIWKEAAS